MQRWLPLLALAGLLILAGLAVVRGLAPVTPVQADEGTRDPLGDTFPTGVEPAPLPFTYQGQLKLNGLPVTDQCDFRFRLYDAETGGAQIGPQEAVNNVQARAGLFSVQLTAIGNRILPNVLQDLSYLEIDVRCPAGSGAFTTLAPRQPFTPTAYARYAYRLPALRIEPKPESPAPNLIGGGSGNAVAPAVYGATIAGGGGVAPSDTNTVAGAYGAVGGGRNNRAGVYPAGGPVPAGSHTTVSGGDSNTANGNYSMIPGGQANTTEGDYSMAAGRRAKAAHDGALVWADATDTDFSSSAPNQVAIRAANGVRLASDAGSGKSVNVGEYYRDNSIIAWARVTAGGGLSADFGVASVARPSAGQYIMTLTASSRSALSLIPMAVAETDTAPVGASNVRIVSVNQVGTGEFRVYITNGSYNLVDNDFVFMVTGR